MQKHDEGENFHGTTSILSHLFSQVCFLVVYLAFYATVHYKLARLGT